MKLKLLILVSIILLPLVRGYTQEIDTTHYFNLSVGNFWVYNYYYQTLHGSYNYNFKSEVLKDSIRNNKKYYVITNIAYDYCCMQNSDTTLIRIDSTANVLYIFDNNTICGGERTLFDLSAIAGQTHGSCAFMQYTCFGIQTDSVFSIPSYSKRYFYQWSAQGHGGSTNYKIIKNFGFNEIVKNSYGSANAVVMITKLIGCKINSSVYGDTTITPLTYNNFNETYLSDFRLSQNYPNPFNPSTKISFSISKNSFVRLNVYNVLGQNIETLVNQNINPGFYEVQWSAMNYPSGVYFYKLETENFSEVKKMVLKK